MQDDRNCDFCTITMAYTHCGKDFRGRYKGKQVSCIGCGHCHSSPLPLYQKHASEWSDNVNDNVLVGRGGEKRTHFRLSGSLCHPCPIPHGGHKISRVPLSRPSLVAWTRRRSHQLALMGVGDQIGGDCPDWEGLFQLQMRISFPVLLSKDLRRVLLLTRTRSF